MENQNETYRFNNGVEIPRFGPGTWFIDDKNAAQAVKVAAEHKTYEEAKAGIDGTLKKMRLDYLDMMIIHSPQPWKALEETYNEGKLKAIGVFNFHRIFHISSFLPETSWIHFQLLQITSLFLSRPYTVYYLY